MTVHPLDDLAAYALGALDADERRAIDAHLATCASCRAEVRSFAETAWLIAEPQSRQVPPRLRAAIVARARQDGSARTAWFATLLNGLRRPVPLMVPLALAAVLVVALLGYGGARRDADRYAAAVAGAVGARGVPPANGAAPYLILDLPAAPAGKTWEAWVIRGDTPVRAGLTDERGVTTLTLTAAVAGGDTIAVTPEPKGGLDAPTGTPVLAGRS